MKPGAREVRPKFEELPPIERDWAAMGPAAATIATVMNTESLTNLLILRSNFLGECGAPRAKARRAKRLRRLQPMERKSNPAGEVYEGKGVRCVRRVHARGGMVRIGFRRV